MSTRSAIGVMQDDGTVKAVYCHSDGYLEHNGAILSAYYNDRAAAEALLALGDLSFLDVSPSPSPSVNHSFLNKAIGVTVAYHRDRGERYIPPAVYGNMEEYPGRARAEMGAKFVYLFEDGEWLVHDGGRFARVADLLKERGLG